MSGRRRRFGTFLRRATALLLSWVMPASTLWGGGGLASPVAAALAPTVESQASTAPSQQPVEARQTDEWATRDDERMEDPEHEHPDCDVEFW
ncbi:MAG TPA: hypothetical protein VMT69_09530, partial [Kineosporiaceae bacterium]|nr:hypothetical protein [Kineosporiaceae bacterium]